jgi:hypothetical protein
VTRSAFAACGVRTVLLAAAALLAASGASAAAVIAASAASSALSGTYRPLQAAVLPWLVRTPAELAASNAVTAVMENSGALIGPLLAGAAAIAYLALVVVGIGNAVVDVSGFTLVTRLAGPGTAGKALGALEFVGLAGLATGSILTPALLHALGVRGTLVLLGGGLAGLALADAVRFRRLDRACPRRARRPGCFATSRGQPPSPRSSH